MCSKKTYKRFKKIYDYIKNHDDYTTNFSLFKTKLGSRYVGSIMDAEHNIIFIYKDYDESNLFKLSINKNGKIIVMYTKIDNPAIFAAIYEIECIINNKNKQHTDSILEKLFECVDEYSIATRLFR